MIFILDQFESHPGDGEALHAFCHERYVPGAIARGMTLVHSLVSPPLWLDDGANRLFFLWSLADAEAFWAKNNLGRRDPDVHELWAELDCRVASRRRDTMADQTCFDVLARG
ncbi:hypothetical protein [Croceicoccus estronivorus]|uniref:hypothetical protein n=1 Tax=Croceicoccus estronivorus TaxID=1172626 RepID=UPI000AFC4545|nr:hypothetical protein [Croceicoccus estronivorus]